MKKRKANKKILKAVDEIQEIYLIINEIKNKDEKKIIHHLFQDLSDKLLDNVQKGKNKMETKRSWWKLTIDDYPNYKPNDVDLEHIAELIKQGYDQGELIQETEDDE